MTEKSDTEAVGKETEDTETQDTEAEFKETHNLEPSTTSMSKSGTFATCLPAPTLGID